MCSIPVLQDHMARCVWWKRVTVAMPTIKVRVLLHVNSNNEDVENIDMQ